MTTAGTSDRDRRAQDFWLDNLGSTDAYTRWVLDEVKPWLGRRILEIGCGTGTYTVPLAMAGHELVSIDIDATYAETAARRTAGLPNVVVRQADATAVGSLGEAFDSIVLLDVLEHLENDVFMLDRLRSRLKPGGCIVLKVPAIKALYSPMDEAIGHYRRYDRRSLADALSGAGLELQALWAFNAIAVPGWWLNGRILGRTTPPQGQLTLFNKLVPVLRPLDRLLRHIGGLSFFAVARRPPGGG
jgi:SAM-dependent methyltransferase